MENWLKKTKSDFSFFKFLIRIQWIDRLATSAFMMGITIQTFLLSFSIFKNADSYDHGMVLAIRSTLLATVGMTMLSSMSNIQNEFRFGTIESICLSRFSFKKLIIFRCLSMALICSPAILLPFIIVAFKYWSSLDYIFYMVIFLIYVAITLVGFQTTFILNAFQTPLNAIPWVKGVLIIIGLELIKFPYSDVIAKCFPFYWIVDLSKGQNIYLSLLWFVCSAIGSTIVLKYAFNKDLDKKIDENFLTGRMV